MPTPASSTPVPSGQGGGTASPKETNARLLAVVADALYRNALSVPCRSATHFRDLAIGLARLIDYAVTYDHKPVNCPRLHQILKQVCQHKRESTLQPAIMVLLISVKNACKIGWFSGAASEELLCLVDEVSKSFCTPRAAVPDQTTILFSVSQIMYRFYPWFKLGHIIASLEAKPGFGAYVVDFLITNDIQRNQNEKIRLLVAAVDNIDTSSCIISPNEVDFLVNGRGVEKRTTTSMDLGPQLPTVVEPLLRYGANLLQAVGRFDGRYVVLLACMSYVPVHEMPTPADYVQPAHPVVDTDADIIEGPSQIKLTCPISFGRIACPAKGHMCKHHQCFDFTNYMKINVYRPSWRCPHCNQFVCYTDIRIDRSMWKILQEVEENVVEVIISEDGSWKIAADRNNHKIEADGRSSASPPEAIGLAEMFFGSSDGQHNIYDLTEGDDNANMDDAILDYKPAVCRSSQLTSALMNSTPMITSNPMNGTPVITSTAINGTMAPFMTTTEISQNTLGTRAGPIAGDLFETSPIFTDSVAPTLNLGQRTSEGTSLPSNPISTSQPSIYRVPFRLNRDIPTQHGSHPLPATPVSGFPVNGYPGHTRNSLSSQSIPRGNNPFQGDLLQQLPVSQIALQRHPATQIRGDTIPVHSSSRMPAPHLRNPVNHDMPSVISAPSHLRSANVAVNERMPQAAQRAASWSRHLQNYPASALMSGQASLSSSRSTESERMAQSAQQVALWSRHLQNYPVHAPTSGMAPLSLPRSLENNVRITTSGEHGPAAPGGLVQSVTRMEDLMVSQSEQNRRPAGRMRGSLSVGQIDAAVALSQHIIRPTNMGLESAPPNSSSNPQRMSQSNTTAPHLRALSRPVIGEGGPAKSTGL